MITNVSAKGNICYFTFHASTGNTANVTMTAVNGRVAANIEWNEPSTKKENCEADLFIAGVISHVHGGALVEISTIDEDDDEKRQQLLMRFLKADEQ